jgi:hypothetical protein
MKQANWVVRYKSAKLLLPAAVWTDPEEGITEQRMKQQASDMFLCWEYQISVNSQGSSVTAVTATGSTTERSGFYSLEEQECLFVP